MSEFQSTPLSGKVALITGATSGIGKVTAQILCQNGASVVISGRRSKEGSQIAENLQAQGNDAVYIKSDLGKVSEINSLVDQTIERFGALDIAFNNAGIFDRGGLFHEYEDASWDDLISINLSAVFYCMKAQISYMVRNGGGVIVNNASIVGHRGSERASPGYVASKHGVIGLTRQAALQYANLGIRVNSISPGPTMTEIQQPLVDEGPKAVAAHLASLNPRAAFVAPQEIANVVLYLCAYAPEMMTGQDVAIDGGQLYKL
ncbi:MAG: hypothetical protein CL470_01310 [Acidimicrobiaceae bacterium]|nr:hypothetical protein [Acidimicrobiaceae bacterium]